MSELRSFHQEDYDTLLMLAKAKIPPIGKSRRGTPINIVMRSRREEKGVSKEEMGNELGMSGSTIWQYEQLRIFPAPESAAALAHFLEVPQEELFPQYLSELQAKKPVDDLPEVVESDLEGRDRSIFRLRKKIGPYDEDATFEDGELQMMIERALKKVTLTHLQRNVLELYAHEDLTFEGIAERVGNSKAAAAEILNKSLAKIRIAVFPKGQRFKR